MTDTSTEIDLGLDQLFSALLRCKDSPILCEILQNSNVFWKSLLSHVILEGSMSTRLLGLRFCRKFLPLLKPANAGANCIQTELILTRLLDISGQGMFPDGSKPSFHKTVLSIEATDVLRVLLTSPSWNQILNMKIAEICTMDFPTIFYQINSKEERTRILSSSSYRHVCSVLFLMAKRFYNPVREGCYCETHLPGSVPSKGAFLIFSSGVLISILGNVSRVGHDEEVSITLNDGRVQIMSANQAEAYLTISEIPTWHVNSLQCNSEVIISALIQLVAFEKDVSLKGSDSEHCDLLLSVLKTHILSALYNLISDSNWASVALNMGAFQTFSKLGLNSFISDSETELKLQRKLSSIYTVESLGPGRRSQQDQSPISHTNSSGIDSLMPSFKFQVRRGSGRRRLHPSPAFSICHEPALDDDEFSAYETNHLGILYCLGTNFGTTFWTNPHELSEVKITASSVAAGSQPIELIANAVLPIVREAASFNSESCPYERFVIDFGARSVRPSGYILRHWRDSDQNALRNWKIEGQGLDESSWVCLRRHMNDSSLKKRASQAMFPLESLEFYHRLRLSMTAPNSSGSWRLALGGLELFGWLRDADGSFISPKILERIPISTDSHLPLSEPQISSPVSDYLSLSDKSRLFCFGKGDNGRL